MDPRVESQFDLPNPESLRLCWSCGMLVRNYATRCRFCGVDLPGEMALPPMVKRAGGKLAAADRQEADGGFPHEAPRRADRSFWLAQGGCVSFLLLLFAAPLLPFFAPLANPGGFTVFSIGVVLLLLIHRLGWMVWSRVYVPGIRNCTVPAGTARAFMGGVTSGRYDYAFALLIPGDKDSAPRGLLYRPKRGFFGGSHLVDTPEHFRGCWRPFRRWFARTVRVSILGERHAVVEGYLRGAFERKRHAIPWTLWLYRVGETWYVVNGGPFSGEGMLPKLYHDCLADLHEGRLPSMDRVARAAGRGEGEAVASESGHDG